MKSPTIVTITVPLDLPLALVNQIEHECSRINMSIPEKLARDLIDAYNERNAEEAERAAAENLQALGGVDVHTFDATAPLPLMAPPSTPSLRTPVASFSGVPSAGGTGLASG